MLQRPSSVYFPSLENKISIFEQGCANLEKAETNNLETNNDAKSSPMSTSNLSDPAKG